MTLRRRMKAMEERTGERSAREEEQGVEERDRKEG